MLLAEGAGNWPYQVKEIDLVSVSGAALLPEGLDARFREGAELVRTHCLACHKANGFGGEKFEGDLAEIAKGYAEADFLRLVPTSASERSGATMPAISDRLPEPERRRIARILFDYLKAVPVQPWGSATPGRTGSTRSSRRIAKRFKLTVQPRPLFWACGSSGTGLQR